MMTDEERQRVEEIREDWNPGQYATVGYNEITFLLDLLERTEAERERLERALWELLEGAEDMRGYVSDFFAEKWGHDEYLARARTVLGPERIEALEGAGNE